MEFSTKAYSALHKKIEWMRKEANPTHEFIAPPVCASCNGNFTLKNKVVASYYKEIDLAVYFILCETCGQLDDLDELQIGRNKTKQKLIALWNNGTGKGSLRNGKTIINDR